MITFVLLFAAFIPGSLLCSEGNGIKNPLAWRQDKTPSPESELKVLVPQKGANYHVDDVIDVVWRGLAKAVNYKLEVTDQQGRQSFNTPSTSYKYTIRAQGFHQIRVTATKRWGKQIGLTDWINFMANYPMAPLKSKVIHEIPYTVQVVISKMPKEFFSPNPTKPHYQALDIYSPQPNSQMYPGLVAFLWENLAGEYKLQLFDIDASQTLFKNTSLINQLVFQIDTPGTYQFRAASSSSKRELSTVTFNVIPREEKIHIPIDNKVLRTIQQIIPLLSAAPPFPIDVPNGFFKANHHDETADLKPAIYVPQKSSQMCPGPLTILWGNSIYPNWNLKVFSLNSLLTLFDQTLTINRAKIVFTDPGRYLIQLRKLFSDVAPDMLNMVEFSVTSTGEKINTPVKTYIQPERQKEVVLVPDHRPRLNAFLLPPAFSKPLFNKLVGSPPAIYVPQEGSQMHEGNLTILWEKFISSNLKVIDFDTGLILYDQILQVNQMTITFKKGVYIIMVSHIFVNIGPGKSNAVTFRVLPLGKNLGLPVKTFLRKIKPITTKPQNKIKTINLARLKFDPKLPPEFFKFDPSKPSLSKITVYAPQPESEMYPGVFTILWEHMGNFAPTLTIIDVDEEEYLIHEKVKTNYITFLFRTPGDYAVILHKSGGDDVEEWTSVLFHVVPHDKRLENPMMTYILEHAWIPTRRERGKNLLE